MTGYQWVTVGLGALGFLITWSGMWFGAGIFVEKLRGELKEHVETERDKVIVLIRELEGKFEDEQKSQDRKFGEVGAAMRQYTADVEKKQREIEIWGRDNYVQKGEFDSMRQDIKALARSIKEDFREVFAKIDARP